MGGNDPTAMADLLSRLEAAVSRLEMLDRSSGLSNSNKAPSPAAKLKPQETEVKPSSVAAFEELIEERIGRLTASSEKIGGQVLEATKLLKSAFEEEKRIVEIIAKCKQPDAESLQKLIKPLADLMIKANSLTEGRRTDAYNHLKVVAESMQALCWVLYTKDSGLSKPIVLVEEGWQSAEFYNNKILVEHRNKDVNHLEWAKAVKELYMPGLREYVKKFHMTGPAWNSGGALLEQLLSMAAPVLAAGPRVPPPPPTGPRVPPPPPAPTSSLPGSSASAAVSKPAMSAVFNEINRGNAVTSGLRKVTDDMKAKNRPDKVGIVPSGQVAETREIKPLPIKVAPPVFELQMDRKWVIENQIDNKNIIISQCNGRQTVYIFGCKGSIIQVQGKVNNITMDKCTKTAIVFKDVVAACELVNCTSVEVQCQGVAPTISIDNTNGCQLYLGKDSLKASITTAKSSEINVVVPGATSDADYVEHALPEQFVNVFEDGRFVTTPVAHSGG